MRPVVHWHYENRILDMTDDLPKYKDIGAEFGGSGQLAALSLCMI